MWFKSEPNGTLRAFDSKLANPLGRLEEGKPWRRTALSAERLSGPRMLRVIYNKFERNDITSNGILEKDILLLA